MSKYTSKRDITPIDFGDTIGIPLTQGFVAIVDKSDADLASKYWSASKRKKAIRKIRLICHIDSKVHSFSKSEYRVEPLIIRG